MTESSGYHKNDSHQEHEKLFRILENLNSILREAQVHNYSKQFILGIQASIEVVEAEIKGFSTRKTEGIDNPNQIPLI